TLFNTLSDSNLDSGSLTSDIVKSGIENSSTDTLSNSDSSLLSEIVNWTFSSLKSAIKQFNPEEFKALRFQDCSNEHQRVQSTEEKEKEDPLISEHHSRDPNIQ
ncbi:24330_t:CDS:2, partial [Gigaspora margarita]